MRYLCVKCLSIEIILRLHFMFVIIAEILHDHMHLPSLNDVSFPVSCLCERFLINTRHVRHPQPLSHSSNGRPGKWNYKRRGGRGLGALFYVKLMGGGGGELAGGFGVIFGGGSTSPCLPCLMTFFQHCCQ